MKVLKTMSIDGYAVEFAGNMDGLTIYKRTYRDEAELYICSGDNVIGVVQMTASGDDMAHVDFINVIEY